jgi:hypothetical protein
VAFDNRVANLAIFIGHALLLAGFAGLFAKFANAPL